MTKLVLSVLDPSPLVAGASARQAFLETRALAQTADRLGYRSFWVQEHHNAASFAGSAPEILIADLAVQTQRIKVGAGGVMLPNYSPLKVAEQFNVLEALHPERIELGIGRATGADPRTSAALLGPGGQAFPDMLRFLMDWLLDASGEAQLPSDHRAFGIRALPAGSRPDLWMLASSAQSAAFAGAMGLKLAFATFLAQGPVDEAIEAYRLAFKPSAFAKEPHAAVALVALAADSEAQAQDQSKSAIAWSILRAGGKFARFPTEDEADAIIQGADPALVRQTRKRSVRGDASTVTEKLVDAAKSYAADELFILSFASQFEARKRSYELIAERLLENA